MAQTIYTEIYAPEGPQHLQARQTLDKHLRMVTTLDGESTEGQSCGERGRWISTQMDYATRKEFVRGMLSAFPEVPFIIHSDVLDNYEAEYSGELDWHEGGQVRECPSYCNIPLPMLACAELERPWEHLILPEAFTDPVDLRFSEWARLSKKWRALRDFQAYEPKRRPLHGALIPRSRVLDVAMRVAQSGDLNLAEEILRDAGAYATGEELDHTKAFLEAAKAGALPVLEEGKVEIDSVDTTSVSLSADGGAYLLAWVWAYNEDVGLPIPENSKPENDENS